ncbi:branched-chain amino acid transport system substrate-binding protein [Deinococcus metalli]|uniref:Branched-chain amino acid ABC transporter substrate-binding protein n=1 Tax=Deinococcus metalli TaxID=1141878 RepID=A0A7W8NR54_9DEIO|nr:ABC transporter substrate-binding protein [Deinococcus metalli]MBB5375787.1 branched-chain amino acid transport system substrate-binding protein [Deinococcus metalli]GHF37049.1 branched-chain amino acid ABC transporter substrate-binding protein [Deinococcus metalli]
MNRNLVLTALLAYGSIATAEVKIGVIVSATGPAASLGIPERNTVALLPQTIGGQRITYTVLDDASDTTAAVTAARKLIQDNKVDLIIGTTTTPASLAMIDVVAEAKVPMISLAASEAIIKPVDAKRAWVFKTPQTDALMAAAIVQHMQQNKIKTVGYIGFNDAYGEGWLAELKKNAAARGIRVVAEERYGRSDTSVTGQILKVVAARPDAVLIGASGVPAVLPQKTLKDRGYAGAIYQTHGVANADFLRVGGKDVEGAILPAGPVLVADQLPDTNPDKKVGLNYVGLYESKYGAGSVSTFGAHLWDAGLLLRKALPVALKQAQPGTAEFRDALRSALEGTRNVIGAHGIFNLSATDHLGLDARSRVMVQVVNGTWKLLK